MNKITKWRKRKKFEEAKRLYETANADQKYVLESLFPELKESEDERVREALIHLVNSNKELSFGIDNYDGIKWGDILAWLEKQGDKSDIGISSTTKQKLKDNLNKALQKETCDSWNEFLDGGEQKPADKVEPMSLDEAIEHCKEKSCGNNACALEHKQLEKWLTELKELKEQKSAWSEEDENILNNILFHLKDNLKDNEVEFIAYKNWLKSLRPKNTWKPSDEQMNTLEYYMHTLICNEHKEVLFGLYADLKKLREE